MPWKETSPMNERVRFVAAMLEGEESFTELCERFGISRKQGYKWKNRYEDGGVTALRDLSRVPHNHPQRIESEVVELLLWLGAGTRLAALASCWFCCAVIIRRWSYQSPARWVRS